MNIKSDFHCKYRGCWWWGFLAFYFKRQQREKRKKCRGVISPITDYLNSCPFQVCPDFVGRIARQHWQTVYCERCRRGKYQSTFIQRNSRKRWQSCSQRNVVLTLHYKLHSDADVRIFGNLSGLLWKLLFQPNLWNSVLLPTANEVCEGYVFTGVCPQGDTPTPAQCILGYGQQGGGMHPSGMYSCYWKVCYVKCTKQKAKL